MKKCLLLIAVLCARLNFASAQNVEVSAGVSGNFSNYSGTAAGSNTSAYTFPIFSKTLTGGYGAAIQMKVVAKDGFFIGLQSGYEVLRTTINVNAYPPVYINAVTPLGGGLQASGTVTNQSFGYETTTSKYINVNPYLGYRLRKRNYSIDLSLGAEVGFAVEDKHRDVYNNSYSYDQSFYFNRTQLYGIQISQQDLRIKGGVGFNYRRVGIDISYAHGINNLVEIKQGYENYGQGSAYSQVIKLALTYNIL